MRRITFLGAVIVTILLAITACGGTGAVNGELAGSTLQTADEASKSPQESISREAASGSASETNVGMKPGKNGTGSGSSDVENPDSDGQDADSSAGLAAESQKEQSPTVSDTQAADSSDSVGASKNEGTTEARPLPSSKDNKGGSAGIIAESGNTVTDQDSGKVMEELERELDDLFNSINKLDDVDSTELNGEVNVK